MKRAWRDQLAGAVKREEAARADDGPMVWATSGPTYADKWMVFLNINTARAMARAGLIEVVDPGTWDSPTSYRLTTAGREAAS